MKIFFCL